MNLKKDDILTDRMQLCIKGGKEMKDPDTAFSKKLLTPHREYHRAYNPACCLSGGQDHGRYSGRNVQAILRQSVSKSDLNPVWNTSYPEASLLEKGTNLRYIQQLPGPVSTQTNEKYLHIASQGEAI